jgi:hypothetical protein
LRTLQELLQLVNSFENAYSNILIGFSYLECKLIYYEIILGFLRKTFL